MIFTYHNAKFELDPFDSYHRGAIVQAVNYRIGRRKFWSEPTQQLCQQLLQGRERPVVVDIGCNIGLFSLPLAIAFPQATFYAVDAHPTPSAAFLRHVKLNRVQNVKQMQAAISTASGPVEIYENPMNSGGHRLAGFEGRSDLAAYPIRSVTVPSLTLAAVFEHYAITQCDLLKIDTEGQEYDILVSLGERLHPIKDGNGVRAVIAEYGSEGLRAAGTSVGELWRLMDQHGYQAQIIQTGQRIKAAADIPELPPFQILDFFFTAKDSA